MIKVTRKKKTPLRKCVVTNEMKPKEELIRIVRTPDGEVFVDPTSKKSGRGAYITLEEAIVLEAKNKNILSRHLKVKIPEDVYDALLHEIRKNR